MNFKNNWIWLTIAVGLFVFIYVEQRVKPLATGPQKVLPEFKAEAVTSIQVLPKDERALRVERTNGGWQLTQPVVYPAKDVPIELLLTALEELTPALPPLGSTETRNRPNADQEFGFAPPQASVILRQGDVERRLWIGNRTPPGDQVFVQVVGNEETYVVDAGLLEYVPTRINDWRDPILVDLRDVKFDRILATNGPSVLELQFSTNAGWRMLQPLATRANLGSVQTALQNVQDLRAMEFHDSAADLEPFGLKTPALSIVLKSGTNTAFHLDVGRTNETGQFYARRAGEGTVVAVDKSLIEPWLASNSRYFREFMDLHLVGLTAIPETIEVRAHDTFTLQRQTNGTWRVVDAFPADSGLVKELLANLAQIEGEIAQEVVTEPDLPDYGLAAPLREYILQMSGTTNHLLFGTNADQKVFARCKGESFVYSVRPSELDRLPVASWQMRDQRLWKFDENDVARILVEEGGRTRELLRNGTNDWQLGVGSEGIILDPVKEAAIEYTVDLLGELSAAAWVQRGDANLSQYGFAPENRKVTVELKNGTKLSVQFGGFAPSNHAYAMTVLDQEPWVFQFPAGLFSFIERYLSIPKPS